jgi:hypothetical protein
MLIRRVWAGTKMITKKTCRRARVLQICVCLCTMMAAWIVAFPFAESVSLEAKEPKIAREEGEFKIVFGGNEIGSEKFVIIGSDESASSSSVLEFRNPADRHQKVQMESKLEMGPHYVAKDYRLTSDVDGKKGSIHAEFSPHQVMFEFTGSGVAHRSGLLLGNECTLLDTNIFHHFIFLARLFDNGGRDKTQKFEVVIPQEQDDGQVTLTEMSGETLSIKGKRMEAHRIKVDSGSVQIYLWLDRNRILQKISVPGKGIEVFRSP